jgi:hypothetical protein
MQLMLTEDSTAGKLVGSLNERLYGIKHNLAQICRPVRLASEITDVDVAINAHFYRPLMFVILLP